MKRLFCIPLLALGLLFAPAATLHAQQEVEIVPLKSRTVEQVLPALLPLVEPGGGLSGMNNQLILKASRRNREQLKQALAAIDQPPRLLRIRISQQREMEGIVRDQGVSGSVSLGNNVRLIQPSGSGNRDGVVRLQRGDSTIDARWQERQSSRSGTSEQMVQVMEGGKAFIQVGRSVPVPQRQAVMTPNGMVVTTGTVYRDIGQGFYAEPRLVGDRVTLDISPQSDSPGAYGPGSADIQRLSTTVSGRLGEWIPLGGVSQSSSSRERSNGTVAEDERRDDRTLWLMVEEIK